MRWTALAERNFKETLRDPLSLGLGIAMPCALLALFASLGKTAPVPLFKPAALAPALAVFSFAFIVMFAAMLLSKDRSSGLFGRLRATPLEPGDFALAYCLPYLPFALLQAAACYALGAAFGAPLGPGALASLLVLAPMAASCTGIGLMLGALCTENQIAGLGSALVSTIGIFGGAWFDLEAAGGFFAAVSRVFPIAHAVHGARVLFAGGAVVDSVPDIAIAWLFAAAALGAGVACLRARTKP
jgi:ABC-2 type transport system permease protein